MLNNKSLLLFLAATATVEGFSTVFPKSKGISTYQSHHQFQVASFGLNSLAATEEESIETADVPAEEESVEVSAAAAAAAAATEESSNEKPVRPEEDLSKIAYVVNLSYDTPGWKLRELFSEFGEVEKVFIPKERNTGRSKGMAFVTMTSEEQRDTAMEKLNEIELDGRIMYVDKAKPRSESKQPGKAKDRVQETNNTKMYVGNISYETTKESLQTFFGEYGTVLDVYIPVDKATEAPRGFAFVTMEKEDASKAIESASGVELDGRVIEVKESLPRGQKAPPRQNSRSSNEMKIYVGNLSFDTEEDTLRALFEEFGELIDLYIPTDRYSGRPRGFAFVTMEKDNASRAIEAIDGLEVDERIIRVNEAQPKGYQASFSNDWEEEGEWGEE